MILDLDPDLLWNVQTWIQKSWQA